MNDIKEKAAIQAAIEKRYSVNVGMPVIGKAASLAVGSLQNTTIVDRSYSTFKNDMQNFIHRIMKHDFGAGIWPRVMMAVPPTAGDLAAFPAMLDPNDRFCYLTFNLPPDKACLLENKVLYCGALYNQQFRVRKQGDSYDLVVFYVDNTGGVISLLTHRMNINPTGGINSTSEFYSLPVLPTLKEQAPVKGVGGLDEVASLVVDEGGILSPIPLQAYPAQLQPAVDGIIGVGFVFKHQSDDPTACSITVNPIFGNIETVPVIKDLLTELYS